MLGILLASLRRRPAPPIHSSDAPRPRSDSLPLRRLKLALQFAGRGVLVWLAFAFASFAHWMPATFGDVSLGQILFHWRYLGATGSIGKVYATEFVIQCLLWPLAAAVLAIWFERRAMRPLIARSGPLWRRRLFLAASVTPTLVIIGCTGVLAWRTSALQFLWPQSDNGYFATHYVPPATARVAAAKRMNLVLIYVESLESSYGRPDVFGRDLLASLTELRPLSFETYEQLPGTGYTMAAIVSTQCGVPMQMVGFLDWRQQGEQTRQFLPRAVCLGDILSAQGYRNVFMGGANLDFSGKGKFLSQHRFGDAYGRNEWLQLGIPKARLSGWGLHDDDLFEQAKSKLRELHAAGQLFNLTLLTVDTHWPSGYVSPRCKERDVKALDGVVECTTRMVADLIAFARASGYDEDTNIVVIGDHLSPPNSLSGELSKVGRRTIYNAFFARDQPKPNRSTIVHFDMLPTILDFIGMRPEGGRAGLGFSAFGAPPVPFPTARSRAQMAEHTMTPSAAYLELWEPTH